MKPDDPVKKDWPRRAIGPQGNSAMFQCPGDVPHGWRLEKSLAVEAAEKVVFPPDVPARDDVRVYTSLEPGAVPKRGPGRPKKAAG